MRFDMKRQIEMLETLKKALVREFFANVEKCIVMLIAKLQLEVDMASLRTSWLTEPLPQQVLEDSSWMRIVHFFLIESPYPGQSNRKNNEIDKWAPAPWVGIRSLKTSLNQAIIQSQGC